MDIIKQIQEHPEVEKVREEMQQKITEAERETEKQTEMVQELEDKHADNYWYFEKDTNFLHEIVEDITSGEIDTLSLDGFKNRIKVQRFENKGDFTFLDQLYDVLDKIEQDAIVKTVEVEKIVEREIKVPEPYEVEVLPGGFKADIRKIINILSKYDGE